MDRVISAFMAIITQRCGSEASSLSQHGDEVWLPQGDIESVILTVALPQECDR